MPNKLKRLDNGVKWYDVVMRDRDRLSGKTFWRLRCEIPTAELLKNPAQMLLEAYKYFDWCDRHPFMVVELVKYKGQATEAEIPRLRPYTVEGLMRYFGKSSRWLYQMRYKTEGKAEKTQLDEDLLEVLNVIEGTIKQQQLEGATSNLLNGAVVIRLLGLKDHHDVTTAGAPVLNIEVKNDSTADALNELGAKLKKEKEG